MRRRGCFWSIVDNIGGVFLDLNNAEAGSDLGYLSFFDEEFLDYAVKRTSDLYACLVALDFAKGIKCLDAR